MTESITAIDIAAAMRAASDRRLATLPAPLPIPLAPRRDLPIRSRSHSRRHRAIR